MVHQSFLQSLAIPDSGLHVAQRRSHLQALQNDRRYSLSDVSAETLALLAIAFAHPISASHKFCNVAALTM